SRPHRAGASRPSSTGRRTPRCGAAPVRLLRSGPEPYRGSALSDLLSVDYDAADAGRRDERGAGRARLPGHVQRGSGQLERVCVVDGVRLGVDGRAVRVVAVPSALLGRQLPSRAVARRRTAGDAGRQAVVANGEDTMCPAEQYGTHLGPRTVG